MRVIDLVCYGFAVLLFIFAGFGRPTVGRPASQWSLGWLGLAFFALPFFLRALDALV